MRNDFEEWLASEDAGPYIIKDALEECRVIMRICKSADIDLLFVQRNYRGIGVSPCEEFRYGGTYCRKDNLLYCVTFDHWLVDMLGIQDATGRSVRALTEQKECAVRRCVEDIIAGDRNNLRVSELTDDILVNRMNDFRDCGAYGEARSRYLSNKGNVPSFECEYRINNNERTVEGLLSYILDPVGAVEHEAAAYIRIHQEAMLFGFLHNDAINKEYQAILDRMEDPVHTVKKIMGAMKASPAKTVNVTIFKDGVEFTFKADAGCFRCDCRYAYSVFDIAAPDQKEFKEIFGRNSDYGPMDIRRITYGKKTLYEAD